MKESRYNIWVDVDDATYLYNGMTGALLRLSNGDREAVARVLADPTETRCSPKLLEQMAHGRMLVPEDADEIDLLAKRYELTRFDTTHFAYTLVTSLGCNFDCPYCFEAKHPSIMSADVQDAILAALDDQLPRINSFTVTWFGGEPLVGKQPLLALSDAFIERCDANEVHYSATITTNGYLLDVETCRQLRDRRVEAVQVCLDGPPEVHDKMRPLVNGKGTFWRIVKNLHHAVEHLSVTIRMNVDALNILRTEELLQILESEGLSGKVGVYPGQIVGVDDGNGSPSSSYGTPCMTNPEYAAAEIEFNELVSRYGFGAPSLPRPSSAPCTAVRKNELVVGSEGELYKCWDSVGNKLEVIGSIFDYANPNGRMQKWIKYDPFTDEECRGCVALPTCMGGCAHHGMDLIQHENRCSTFRHNYREQVVQFVHHAERSGEAAAVAPSGLVRRMDTR